MLANFRHNTYTLSNKRKKRANYNKRFAVSQKKLKKIALAIMPTSYTATLRKTPKLTKCSYATQRANSAGPYNVLMDFLKCVRYCKSWLAMELRELGFQQNEMIHHFDPVKESNSKYELQKNHEFALQLHHIILKNLDPNINKNNDKIQVSPKG